MPSAGELASSKLSPIRRPASTPWRRTGLQRTAGARLRRRVPRRRTRSRIVRFFHGWWPASGVMACGQQMDLDFSREMPMLSAAAVGAGCDAGPVLERSAECWLGLVAHLRGDLGDSGVAGSQQPLCVLHPPVGQLRRGARPTSLVNRAAKADQDGPACAASPRHGPRRPGVLVDQSERRAELRAGKRAEPAVATWRQVGYVRRGSLRRAPWLTRQPMRPAGDSSWRPSLTVTGLRSNAVQRTAQLSGDI